MIMRWLKEHRTPPRPGKRRYAPLNEVLNIEGVASQDPRRIETILTALRTRPGLWLWVSSHVSKGSGNITAHRWRDRWRDFPDAADFRARVVPNDERFDLMLSYKPEYELENE